MQYPKYLLLEKQIFVSENMNPLAFVNSNFYDCVFSLLIDSSQNQEK